MSLLFALVLSVGAFEEAKAQQDEQTRPPPPSVRVVAPKPPSEAEQRAEELMMARQEALIASGDSFGLVTLAMRPIEVAAMCSTVATSANEYAQSLAPEHLERGAFLAEAEQMLADIEPIVAPFRASVGEQDWARYTRRGNETLNIMSMVPLQAATERMNADLEAYESGERDIMLPFIAALGEECVTEDFAEREAFFLSIEGYLTP